MLKIKIICVGKLKEKYFSDAQNEYLKRLSAYCKIEIIEVRDIQIPDKASEKEEEKIKEKEFELMKNHFNKDDYIIALDLKGTSPNSLELSTKLDYFMSNSITNITFLIGGSLGFPNELDKHIKEKIKFSNLTFTHQMCRIILLEQIYRSFKILRNETYHK